MNRQEFFAELRAALEGVIIPSAIQDNINYYNHYIDEQIRAGRSEEEVLEELGDARLIARTIIDSARDGLDASPDGYDSTPNDIGYRGEDGGADGGGSASFGTGRSGQSGYSGDAGEDRRPGHFGNGTDPELRGYRISGWAAALLIFLILFLFLLVFIGIIGGALALIIHFAGPILMIAAVYWILRQLFG